jgi:hypothetical protein
MLEGIVHSRHFAEPDLPIEILREPEFFEVGDVTEIPQERAHERIVLPNQVLIAHARDQLDGPSAGLVEHCSYLADVGTQCDRRRHRCSSTHRVRNGRAAARRGESAEGRVRTRHPPRMHRRRDRGTGGRER